MFADRNLQMSLYVGQVTGDIGPADWSGPAATHRVKSNLWASAQHDTGYLDRNVFHVKHCCKLKRHTLLWDFRLRLIPP